MHNADRQQQTASVACQGDVIQKEDAGAIYKATESELEVPLDLRQDLGDITRGASNWTGPKVTNRIGPARKLFREQLSRVELEGLASSICHCGLSRP